MNDEVNNDIQTVEEFGNIDIKIKPDYYIHNAILKAQNALANEDVKSGFLKFRIFVEQAESFCRACKIVVDGDNYYKEMKEFESNLKEQDKFEKQSKIANKKLELIMTAVFSAGTIFDKLKA